MLLLSHNGAHEDIKVQIIGHCDPNDQEDRVFWLDTLHSKRLNQKQALKQWINWFSVLMSIFYSSGSHIQKDDCLNYYEHCYIEQFKIYTQAIKI